MAPDRRQYGVQAGPTKKYKAVKAQIRELELTRPLGRDEDRDGHVAVDGAVVSVGVRCDVRVEGSGEVLQLQGNHSEALASYHRALSYEQPLPEVQVAIG